MNAPTTRRDSSREAPPVPQTVLCYFCEKTGERAGEDIIPKWLGRQLQDKPTDRWYPGSLVVDEAGRREQQHRPRQTASSWILDDVCKDCNGGWMSKIEDEARRKIIRMVKGEHTLLSAANCHEVARWAQLKWICADALGGDPQLASTVAQQFAQATKPLSYCAVQLGSYRTKRGDPMPAIIWGRKISEIIKRSGKVAVDDRVLGEVVQVTFRFGARHHGRRPLRAGGCRGRR